MDEISVESIKFRGMDVGIIGNKLVQGEKAPEFECQTVDWKKFVGLNDTLGKVRIIASVPSLDTEVCDREIRRFNLEASQLGNEIVVLVVSMDLPYAQKRWCGSAGIDHVITLSDHLSGDFGKKYGCLLENVRILRRAIFVISPDDNIFYSAYMQTLGEEPDYDLVLEHASNALLK